MLHHSRWLDFFGSQYSLLSVISNPRLNHWRILGYTVLNQHLCMLWRRTMSTSSGPIEQSIRRKITESLQPTMLQIHNDSKLHAHHAGMRGSSNTIESHFRLDIVSRAFENKSKPMRHRLVYKLLADEMSMANGVHAIQLSTKTPQEADQKAQQVPQ